MFARFDPRKFLQANTALTYRRRASFLFRCIFIRHTHPHAGKTNITLAQQDRSIDTSPRTPLAICIYIYTRGRGARTSSTDRCLVKSRCAVCGPAAVRSEAMIITRGRHRRARLFRALLNDLRPGPTVLELKFITVVIHPARFATARKRNDAAKA